MMSLSHNCVDGKYTLLRSTCSANVFAFGVLSLSWELLAQQHLSFCVMITHLVSVVRFLVIDSYRPSIFCSFHHCKNGHQMPDETSTVFAFVLAYVARIPFNVDIVDVIQKVRRDLVLEAGCQGRVGSQGVCKGRYSVEITELENS